MHKKTIVLTLLLAIVLPLLTASHLSARRRMTPVDTPATATQAINETRNDTSRINAKRRAASVSYVNDHGQLVYIDTISGDEWIDSMAMFAGRTIPKMEYPLFHALSIGVNIWDPVMRATGQKYGLADAWLELSLHNRYKPIVEIGLGQANSTPSGMNFTYTSPTSMFVRLGANYNFLYNSNPTTPSTPASATDSHPSLTLSPT